MSDQTKLQQLDDIPSDYTSRRDERRERLTQRRADREAGGLGWMIGFVFIAIGVLYLLHNAGMIPNFTNWWALFLLLPGFGTLSAAWRAYQRNGGHWTAEATGPFLMGLLFVGLTVVFLFNLNFGWLWPLLLIAAGLLLLVQSIVPRT